MSIPFSPSIERDGEPELRLSLPMLPWELRSKGIGGSAISAAGIPESFEIRRDRLADVKLRVYEIELEDLLLSLEAIRRSSEAFWFTFNIVDAYSRIRVYLDAPVWPDEIKPVRDTQFPGCFNVSITLRSIDGSAFTEIWLLDE